MAGHCTIASRFNGPPDSGNGGYSCGLLAAQIDGPATVRLHRPPPLDTPLTFRPGTDGKVEMYDGDALVGTAVPAALDLAVPPAPTPAEAEAGASQYRGHREHFFPTCFVCGPGRPARDGLELYTGPVPGGGLVACPWTPAAELADSAGNVREEVVWAALDCPGYFAAMAGDLLPAVLGELAGDLRRAVPAGQPLVVFAWPLGSEGRKHYAGTAVATGSGEVLAIARSTWIELKA